MYGFVVMILACRTFAAKASDPGPL